MKDAKLKALIKSFIESLNDKGMSWLGTAMKARHFSGRGLTSGGRGCAHYGAVAGPEQEKKLLGISDSLIANLKTAFGKGNALTTLGMIENIFDALYDNMAYVGTALDSVKEVAMYIRATVSERMARENEFRQGDDAVMRDIADAEAARLKM